MSSGPLKCPRPHYLGLKLPLSALYPGGPARCRTTGFRLVPCYFDAPVSNTISGSELDNTTGVTSMM